MNGKNKMEDVHCMHAKLLQSRLSATLWTIACQAPLSMGFSRQEYWGGLPCPPPGDLPNPGIEPISLMSPALAGRFFTISITWEDVHYHIICHGEKGAQPKRLAIGDCVYHGTTILYFPSCCC